MAKMYTCLNIPTSLLNSIKERVLIPVQNVFCGLLLGLTCQRTTV